VKHERWESLTDARNKFIKAEPELSEEEWKEGWHFCVHNEFKLVQRGKKCNCHLESWEEATIDDRKI
jgi:hypothetical protein